MHPNDVSLEPAKEHIFTPVSASYCRGATGYGNDPNFSIKSGCSVDQEAVLPCRQGNRGFQAASGSLSNSVIATDGGGRVVLINAAAEQITGWSMREALGRPLVDILGLASQDGDADASITFVKMLAEQQSTETNELWLRPRDGSPVRIAVTAAPIQVDPDSSTGLIVIFRDATQRYESQRQIERAKRLASVSQLAGGVAHGFNNFLVAIRNSCESLKIALGQTEWKNLSCSRSERTRLQSHDDAAVGPGDNVLECLDLILSATERAEELTNRLLTFGRKNVYSATRLDVQAVLNETLDVFSRSTGNRIAFSRNLQAKQRTIIGDKSALQNAILGLGMNAVQAISGRGEITVATRNLYLRRSDCRSSEFDLAPGNYCEISVCDNGQGMTQEQVERAFDPFFSWQSTDLAAGLGLSEVYGVVRDHRWAISIESQPDKGASVRILLPVENSRESETAQSDGNRDRNQCRCILVVEDEEIVRTSATMVLNHIGYDTLEANDGRQALRVYDANADKINLVLLDVNMPVMNGVEAYGFLREKAPELPIVFASGYIDRDDTAVLKRCPVIRKPYSVETLQSMLANALAAS
ncbi:MAG TPA: hypothetical protein DDW52_14580 [Planctomycetaceae bacterium]|nr:hypothetical protein [Planctomycetaceae bacterium]